MTRSVAWALVALALAACHRGRAPSPQAPNPESAGEPTAPREVRLTAEAMRLAGIRTGRVERRALGGGVAVPAEEQFEPSSTAQVGPLVPGRITRVAVSLGELGALGPLLLGDRIMPGFYFVDAERCDAALLTRWLDLALEHVRSLPPK